MLYQQKVILKDIKTSDVIQSFHDKKFVDYLISYQPVKINSWNGIEKGKVASFSFWFFGWKNMKVIHDGYEVSESYLHFEDKGLELPFGLMSWKHHHKVLDHEKGTLIIDHISVESGSSIKKYVIFPIMLIPIFIRKITYKVWFYYINKQ